MLDVPKKLASRLAWSVKRRGVRDTVKMVPQVVVARLKHRFHPEGRAYVQADRAFDERYGGIDTAGFISPVELDFEGSAKDGANGYQAVGEESVREMMNSVPLEHEKFTFVDFGSGKGRACLLASEFPFEQIIGVELSESLHQVACDNVEKFTPPWPQRCNHITPVQADATTYALPEKPLVIFMYNPFLADIMRKVVAHIVRDLEAKPREAYLFYNRPNHANVLEEFDAISLLDEREYWKAYRIGQA